MDPIFEQALAEGNAAFQAVAEHMVVMGAARTEREVDAGDMRWRITVEAVGRVGED